MSILPAIFERLNEATLHSHALTEPAVWTPSGGAPIEIRAHFWDKFSVPDKYQLGAESSTPIALVQTADVDGDNQGFTIARGDVLECREVSYRVRGIETRGDGATLLRLSQD